MTLPLRTLWSFAASVRRGHGTGLFLLGRTLGARRKPPAVKSLNHLFVALLASFQVSVKSMNLTSPHQTLRRWGASALWCLSALSATSWAQVNAPNATEASSGGYFTTPGNGPTRGGPQLGEQDTQPGADTLPLAPRLGTNTQIMNGSNLSKPASTEPSAVVT